MGRDALNSLPKRNERKCRKKCLEFINFNGMKQCFFKLSHEDGRKAPPVAAALFRLRTGNDQSEAIRFC